MRTNVASLRRAIFAGTLPVNLYGTILSPEGVVEGKLQSALSVPGRNGNFLNVVITPPRRFCPWSAGMVIHMSAASNRMDQIDVEGVTRACVLNVEEKTFPDMQLPIRANVVAAPSW